jgi:hypothetical protein
LHQVFAVVDEQPHLALWAVESSGWQVRLSEGSAGDRERVDRIRLAKRTSGVTRVRDQLRWHPDDPLPRCQQITFQTAGKVSAVLHRPPSLRALLRCPGNELEMISRGRTGRALRELAALRVADHHRMTALVRVDPDHHHHPRLSFP